MVKGMLDLSAKLTFVQIFFRRKLISLAHDRLWLDEIREWHQLDSGKRHYRKNVRHRGQIRIREAEVRLLSVLRTSLLCLNCLKKYLENQSHLIGIP